MTEKTASRTLVKSPPELWAEVSDAGSLARHLGEFGEIRITRLEGESTVAWEGERASGTVELAPSGWGTRVTLTARSVEAEAESEPEPEAVAESEPEPVAEPELEPEPEAVEESEPEPVAEPEPLADPGPEPLAAPPRRGLVARLRDRWRATAPQPEPVEEPVAAEPIVAQPLPERLTPDPDAVAEPLARAAAQPEPVAESAPEPEPAAEPEPEADDETLAALTTALDSLGAAHHRPFSRG